MIYLELLKELDKSIESQIIELNKTDWFKRHVVVTNLKNALCHIKREIRRGEIK